MRATYPILLTSCASLDHHYDTTIALFAHLQAMDKHAQKVQAFIKRCFTVPNPSVQVAAVQVCGMAG